jgi:glycosyltransferase involved in cell wall biosynthesis
MSGVAFIIGSFRRGGAERDLLELVRRLDRRRHDPHVLYVAREGDMLPEFEKAGVPLVPLGIRSLRSIAGMRGLARARNYLRRHRIRILQGFGTYGSLYAAVAAHGLPGVALIAYEFTAARPASLREKMFQPWYYRRADVIVGNSDAVLAAVSSRRGAAGKRLVKIHNGVDMGAYAASAGDDVGTLPDLATLPAGTPVVGVVGRLHPIKGHRYLVRGWPLVTARFPGARLILAGPATPAQHAAIGREASLAGCSDSVIIAGLRHDVPRLLGAMDVVVVPSLAEGFSNVVVEAAAAGRSVVATRVGGNAEAIVDGETGLLVEPRDPIALARAILTLLEDPARRRRMGESARRRVSEMFTVEKMIEGYEALYASLAGGSIARGSLAR